MKRSSDGCGCCGAMVCLWQWVEICDGVGGGGLAVVFVVVKGRRLRSVVVVVGFMGGFWESSGRLKVRGGFGMQWRAHANVRVVVNCAGVLGGRRRSYCAEEEKFGFALWFSGFSLDCWPKGEVEGEGSVSFVRRDALNWSGRRHGFGLANGRSTEVSQVAGSEKEGRWVGGFVRLRPSHDGVRQRRRVGGEGRP